MGRDDDAGMKRDCACTKQPNHVGMKQPHIKSRAPGGGRKSMPINQKRVPIRLHVLPQTKSDIAKVADLLNCSQGKALDEAVKYCLHCLTHTA